MSDLVFKASELLSWLNLMVLPGIYWVIKVEKRLTAMETKFDMCFDLKPKEKGESK